MLILVILGGSLLVFRALGFAGLKPFQSWRSCARYALAAMLLFTGGSRFMPGVAEDLTWMVPDWVPDARLAVLASGMLEIFGAVGLLVPSTMRLSGVLLAIFFVAIFPANIYAAKTRATIAGQEAMNLWLRAPMQLLFIWLALWTTKLEPARR
jgi:uncharacterized membrane protein